ncbi:hypothetical protein BH09PAT1_BH09PAT1_6150 [soil metagenome]
MNQLIRKFKIYGFKQFSSFVLIDLKNRIFMQWLRKSYSQKGEDLIIDKLLNYRKKGFYVDVGANDPDRFSNTKRFYLKGWKGINIEPVKKNYANFLVKRKRDINLNIGVGDRSSSLTFYEFLPDALSTFSKSTADNYKKQGYDFIGSSIIKVETLAEILHKHLAEKSIDLLSVDVEGFDLKVLQGNNWDIFRPKVICVESVVHDITGSNKLERKDIHKFLVDKGYEKRFDNNLNSIYMLKKSKN